ncbi:enoyl-CoA hydratase/isomerase family protein [Chloroflexota bacterium]
MDYKEIIFEKAKPLATITLNRPDKLNAYTWRMGREIVKALEESSKDRNIRVVIVTGAGRGFCAGVDLNDPPGGPSIPIRRDNRMGPPVRKLKNFDKPVIAAMNGVAVGGGLSFAMACDIRIASDRARFSMAFVKRGFAPDVGSSWLLPRIVGMARACELALTGDIIDAAEAERIGLVNRVVPHDDLLPAVRELATRIAKNPPAAVQLAKRVMYQGARTDDLPSHMELEGHYTAISMATKDYQEATRAYFEKREPVFKLR